jgi:hypothetical protein
LNSTLAIRGESDREMGGKWSRVNQLRSALLHFDFKTDVYSSKRSVRSAVAIPSIVCTAKKLGKSTVDVSRSNIVPR